MNHSIDQTSNLNQYNRVKRLFLSQRPRGGEGLHACRELREPSRRPGVPMDPRSGAGMTSERGQRPTCRWPRGGVRCEKGHGSAPAPSGGGIGRCPLPPLSPFRGHLPLKGGEGRVWRCSHSCHSGRVAAGLTGARSPLCPLFGDISPSRGRGARVAMPALPHHAVQSAFCRRPTLRPSPRASIARPGAHSFPERGRWDWGGRAALR